MVLLVMTNWLTACHGTDDPFSEYLLNMVIFPPAHSVGFEEGIRINFEVIFFGDM